MNYKNYNYYFIPIENDDENKQLIAVLDCSVSISPCTISFKLIGIKSLHLIKKLKKF